MTPIHTSVIYALLDRADERHERAVAWYRSALPEVVTTPLILAEVDHLVLARAGPLAASAWRADLTAGAYAVEWWDDAVAEAVAIAEHHRDLGLGLADASLVALAGRLGTARIATFDERHFRAVRPLAGGDGFELVPVDAG